MTKHIQNLHRLCEKMAARYGEDDTLVLELKQEIMICEAKKTRDANRENLRRRDLYSYSNLVTQPLH